MQIHENSERNKKRARHLVPTKSALNEGRGGHSQDSSRSVQLAVLPLLALHLIRGNSSIREVVVHQPTLAGPIARYIIVNVGRWEAKSVLLDSLLCCSDSSKRSTGASRIRHK